MNNKIITIALAVPQAFPWKRDLYNIEENKISNILEEFDINTEDKRRIVGWKISNAIFKNLLSSEDNVELIDKVLKELSGKKYAIKEVIESFVRRKRFYNKQEIETFKRILTGKSTIIENKRNRENIILWLIELVTFNIVIEKSIVEKEEVTEEIFRVVNEYFKELNIDKKRIIEMQQKLALLKKSNINLILKNFNKEDNVYKMFLSNFEKSEKIVNEKFEAKEDLLADSLFSILNEFEESPLENNLMVAKNIDEKIKKKFVREKVKNEKEQVEESKIKKEKNHKLEKNINSNKNNVEKNLKALAESLGYSIVKEEILKEDEKIEILKEMASLKKGAVLSELYNAYTNIEEMSKDNLEAILSNFFTTLKLQGFEVDNRNEVGEEIIVDTKNLLSEFLFSKAINVNGRVEGNIKYLGWNYKGKRVVPMIIKPKI
ncbi:MAG: hypothetical protein ACRDD2_13370 [Sarcina sp.]